MPTRSLLVAAATFLFSACISPDNHSPIVVRDSAGVLVAENSLAASGAEWRLQLPPVLIIGQNEKTETGPELFGRINQVIRLSTGDIAVAENQTGEIRIFDDGGAHLRTFGRLGDGPGEFANLWTISELPGDTIAAVDPFGERISLFASSGEFARSFRIPRHLGASAPNVIGWLEDGPLIVSALTLTPSEEPRDQSTHFLYSVDRRGTILATLGEFAGERMGRNSYPLAFGSRAQFAIGGNFVWYGHSSLLELIGLDSSGSVRRIVRADRAPQAVTQGDIDASRAAVEERLQGMTGPAVDRIRATEFASNHPAYGRFLFDEADNLWVEQYRSDLLENSGERRWDIFDAEGKFTGYLAAPSGFRITYIGTQMVLGVHSDSLGGETVQMYRLK